MSTNVTLHKGHDVAYFTSGQGRGGCAGAMSYYTAAGEPPGQWAGKGASALGLSGQVDPDVIGRLYQENTGPGGELLVRRRQSKATKEREAAAVAAYRAAHPYASAVELAEVCTTERGKDPHQVPYFDLTVSAVKSVSVLHANDLANDLYQLGEVQAARDLDQDALDRLRRVLGDDHPHTLSCASNLAIDLRKLGEVQAARDLDQDTLERRRRVLGEGHPDTLASASNLAADLRALGDADES